jgi:hypothetical protein
MIERGLMPTTPKWILEAWRELKPRLAQDSRKNGLPVFRTMLGERDLTPSMLPKVLFDRRFVTELESRIRKHAISKAKRKRRPQTPTIDVEREGEAFRIIGPSAPPHHSKFDLYLKFLDRMPPDRLALLLGYLEKHKQFASSDQQAKAKAKEIVRQVREIGNKRGDLFKADIGAFEICDWRRPRAVRKLKPEDIEERDWDSDGILSLAGYRVGATKGRPAPDRQRNLLRVYLGEFDPLIPEWVKIDWGKPGTSRRLEKMAVAITEFARLAGGRDKGRGKDAIRHWRDDLKFLKDEIYSGRYDFLWPTMGLS